MEEKFPYYHKNYGKQIAWLFNSDNNHLLGKSADLSVLSLKDFDLYVGLLYNFTMLSHYYYENYEYREFRFNRIEKTFQFRIPYFERNQIDPDHFYYHYRDIVNIKTIENFQNLLNLHFGLLNGLREKDLFIDSIQYAYDSKESDEWKYHHNVEKWHDLYVKIRALCYAFDNDLVFQRKEICDKMRGEEMTLLHIIYDNLRTCNFTAVFR